MNQPSNSAILAINLGEYNCVVCILEQGTGEYCFTTFDTSRAELQQVLIKGAAGVVGIEACLLAGRGDDRCGELVVHCLVANRA